MNKKQQQKWWIAGAVVGGVGLLATVVVLSSGNKNKIALATPERGNPTITPPAQPTSPTHNTSTSPTSNASNTDTIAVQTLLYTYYPNTIRKIGDIGSNGKPDGIWGTNTQKVVQSVIANYGWTGVAQLTEWAKNGWIVVRREFDEGVKGLAGLELNV